MPTSATSDAITWVVVLSLSITLYASTHTLTRRKLRRKTYLKPLIPVSIVIMTCAVFAGLEPTNPMILAALAGYIVLGFGAAGWLVGLQQAKTTVPATRPTHRYRWAICAGVIIMAAAYFLNRYHTIHYPH